MTHADDNGMVIPPRLAQKHVVIIPIIKNDADEEAVLAYCTDLQEKLTAQVYDGSKVRVIIDKRDINPGEKGWSWIKKGIPLRVEVGPRDMENNSVFVGRRDKDKKEGVLKDEFVANICGYSPGYSGWHANKSKGIS